MERRRRSLPSDWAIQQPGVTCVIAGARTAKQAEDNAGGLGWKIVPGDLKRVDEILAAHIGEDQP